MADKCKGLKGKQLAICKKGTKDDWFTILMGSGFTEVEGPFKTKSDANWVRGDIESAALTREESGLYSSGRYYVGRKQVLLKQGFDWAFE